MIKNILIIIISISLLSCSNKREKLINHNWNIVDGNYKNQKIDFYNTADIQIVNLDGTQKVDLYFSSERNKISLPGINSSDIRAIFTIQRDSIRFELDTVKYNFVHKAKDSSEISNEDFFGNDLGFTMEEAHKRSIEWINKNPIKTNEYGTQMKIYGNPFHYEIENDILILKSKTTKIIAERDKSLDKLF
tara:strand:- start:1785 stop:2354 length:570 start_codon:yes stop_codon:yes gene_type:complete